VEGPGISCGERLAIIVSPLKGRGRGGVCIFWLTQPKKGEEGKVERLERNDHTHLKGKGGGMCIFTLKLDFELL